MYAETTATRKVARLHKRIRAVQGGTSASKTISILLVLIAKCQTDKSYKLTSVVSESMPHLKKGAIRDFKSIMQEHNYWVDSRWNATDFIYTFETGSQLEFFSADQPGKVRGPRRDRCFMNECNNVSNGLEVFNQLEVRTRDEFWLDWNPAEAFWFEEEILSNPDMEVDHIIITYRDNEALEESIVKSIESRQSNKNWWRVYGLGLVGEVEGRIYTGWQTIAEVPHEARLERRGLDFGYSNDPAALVDIYYYNGSYILDEQLYRKGMGNKAIADFVENLEIPSTIVIADSAEPKSIDELKLYGIAVLPANKGQGSVNQGIQHLQAQRISVTSRSTNLLKEYRSYMWATDKDGKQLDVPEGGMDHLLDAARYAMESLRAKDHKQSSFRDNRYQNKRLARR